LKKAGENFVRIWALPKSFKDVKLGFAQTHRGRCPRPPPPFEKGGRKLYSDLGFAQTRLSTGSWASPKPTGGAAPGPCRLLKKAGENFSESKIDFRGDMGS